MHYFAFLTLDRFYVEQRLGEGWPTDKPLAIHKEKAVIDASEKAVAAGVRIGMRLQEAKTILQDRSCLEAWTEAPYRDRARRWLDVCAVYTSRIEPQCQHEAFLDLSGHSEPFDLAAALGERLGALGFRVGKIGFGQAKWIAEVAAAPPPFDPAEARRWIGDAAQELSHRRVEDLLPIQPDHRRRLRFLGYRTIGEVAHLPLRVLKQQFGDDAATILDAANGRLAQPFRATYPQTSLAAIAQSPDGAALWEHVLEMIRQVASALHAGLADRDAYAETVELNLEWEDGSRTRCSRTFGKPIATRKDLERAIAVLLPEMKQPLIELRAHLPALAKIVRKQRTLESTHEPRERSLSAELAFRAIRKVHGDDAIQVAGDQEPPRRVRVLRAWKEANGWH